MLSVKGVQAPYGKVETLCHGVQAVDALSKDKAPLGMTPLEWCQAQSQDPIISQIIGEINNKTIAKMKIRMGMPSELKALIRNRKLLTLKHGVLYKRSKVDARTKHLLVVPPSHRQRALEECHDQVGHLGQDRVLDLLRDRFYWAGMHVDVVSYINSCPRCLRRKSQPDKAPLVNLETSQPLELIHLDYLKMNLVRETLKMFWLLQITLLGMPRLSPPKLGQHWPQLNYHGIISYFVMDSLPKLLQIRAEILKVS